MDTRIPDFDRAVNAAASTAVSDTQKRDDESRAQEAALEQLTERVNAARSIV